MSKAKAGVWLSATASILSFAAAVVPALKGDQPNVVFFASGTVFPITAIVGARKARTSGDNSQAT